MSVILKSGIKRFRKELLDTIKTDLEDRLKSIAWEISEWTPPWSGPVPWKRKEKPFRGTIHSKAQKKPGYKIIGEITTSFEKPIAIWVAEFGRRGLIRTGRTRTGLPLGFPIQKPPEEARRLLAELLAKRREWIARWDVPPYLEGAPYIVRIIDNQRVVIWNPLSSEAERWLREKHIIFRRVIRPIPPSYFITKLSQKTIKELAFKDLPASIKALARASFAEAEVERYEL